MAYQVIWSDDAQEDIHEILDQLLNNWGDKVADKFSQSIIEVAYILEKQAFIGKRDDKIKAVRQFPIKPYYMIEYTVIIQFNVVYILNVIDSRKVR